MVGITVDPATVRDTRTEHRPVGSVRTFASVWKAWEFDDPVNNVLVSLEHGVTRVDLDVDGDVGVYRDDPEYGPLFDD